jgi:diguanylate cyclase (GGDEF)-like protein
MNILNIQFVLSELNQSTNIDEVTKLKTQKSFNEDIKQLIPLALRENMKIGVLFIRVEDFCQIEKSQTIEKKNEYLETFANTITEMVRDSDIIIRYEDDTFVILLMNIVDEDKTFDMAKKLQLRLTNINTLILKQEVSIGVAMFPEDSKKIKTTIKNAQQSLKDKNRMRNKDVHVFRYIKSKSFLNIFD